ncbi:MAG: DMT family transporter [Burkholderiaceae bacterium]|nr:DMT family transporter [Burkholderiaceae bacterium]
MNPFLAYVSLYASMSLVGTYVAFSKVLVTTFPVLLLASMRFGIAAIAMIPWLKPEPGQTALTSNSKQLIFLQSFFGNFCFSIFMLFGIAHTSAMAAGILMSLLPVCVAFLSWLWLKEKLNARVLIALLLAVATILFINLAKLDSRGSSESASLLGNMLLLAAVICEALYVVIGKKLTGNVSAKRISALSNLVGLTLMLPFGLWAAFGQTSIFDFTAVPLNSWLLLIFYALAASQWSVWLWMKGLKHVQATQAGVFTVALPIASTIVGVFFLKEKFLLSHAIAFICAVFSLVLMISSIKTA